MHGLRKTDAAKEYFFLLERMRGLVDECIQLVHDIKKNSKTR